MNKKQLLSYLISRAILVILVTSGFAQADESITNSSKIEIDDSTFNCIRDMTKVRGFYVGNLRSNIEATVAVANSTNGGKYPMGSVVQLVPGEVMVKHGEGYSPVTNDWEFFELDVTASGSKIRKRGFADVVNRFGGNCFGCHVKAKPQWDLLCETGHGCDPIPLTKNILAILQKTDPRCKNEELTPIERETLINFQKAMKKP